MNNRFQKDQVLGSQSLDQAYIRRAITDRPQTVQRLKLDLSTARDITNPLEITYPFRSLNVEVASDTDAKVYMKPNTKEDLQDFFALTKNTTWVVEHSIAKAYFHWAAQTGKTMEIMLFADSEYRSGSIISQNAGGVSINEGSARTTARVDLPAITATAVLALDTTRKIAQIQNNTGADIWLGNASVSNTGANLGIQLPAGAIYIDKNTSALYAYSVAGGSGDNGLLVMTEA